MNVGFTDTLNHHTLQFRLPSADDDSLMDEEDEEAGGGGGAGGGVRKYRVMLQQASARLGREKGKWMDGSPYVIRPHTHAKPPRQSHTTTTQHNPQIKQQIADRERTSLLVELDDVLSFPLGGEDGGVGGGDLVDQMMGVAISTAADAFVQRCVCGCRGCCGVGDGVMGLIIVRAAVGLRFVVVVVGLGLWVGFSSVRHATEPVERILERDVQGGGQRAAVPAALRRGRLPGTK